MLPSRIVSRCHLHSVICVARAKREKICKDKVIAKKNAEYPEQWYTVGSWKCTKAATATINLKHHVYGINSTGNGNCATQARKCVGLERSLYVANESP